MQPTIKVFFLMLAILCFFISESQGAQKKYAESLVGCSLPLSDHLKLDCTEQRLAIDIQQRLYKAQSYEELEALILERARYFLAEKTYDYQSVLSLMMYPVRGKAKWIKKFTAFKGGHLPYARIALARIQGILPAECSEKKKKQFLLREICRAPVSPGTEASKRTIKARGKTYDKG